MSRSRSFEQILELRRKTMEAAYAHWIHYDLFSFNWWLLLASSILPWFIWWKIVNRQKIVQILLYGSMVSLISLFLDVVGINLQLWYYPTSLLTMVPVLFPADVTVIAIAYMLLYQYFVKPRAFFMAALLLAAFFAFVGEPCLIWLGIYQTIRWKHVYSFVVYTSLAHLVKWTIHQVLKYRIPEKDAPRENCGTGKR